MVDDWEILGEFAQNLKASMRNLRIRRENYCMFLNSVCEVRICFQQDFHFVYKSCVEQDTFQK